MYEQELKTVLRKETAVAKVRLSHRRRIKQTCRAPVAGSHCDARGATASLIVALCNKFKVEDTTEEDQAQSLGGPRA